MQKSLVQALLIVVIGAIALNMMLQLGETTSLGKCINYLRGHGYWVMAAGQCFDADLVPCSDNTTDLGSSTHRWRDEYLSGSIQVGGGVIPLTLPDGSAYFDAGVRIRTAHGGFGLVALGHDAVMPLHSGTGSFDLTGGTYDNQFTSTTPIFEAEDMEKSNWIVISGGDYFGAAAEVETYIDANNVALHTMNWAWDMTNVPFVVVAHPIFASCAAGHVHIDAKSLGDFRVHSYEHIGGCLGYFELDAGKDDTSNLCLHTDAAGYSGVESIDMDYRTGDLQPDDHASIVKIALDETGAVSSNTTTEIDFINFITTDNQTAIKNALRVRQGFDSALKVSGGIRENPDYGYQVTLANVATDRVNGIPPDGTAFLDTSASDELLFGADGDYVLIGDDNTFEATESVISLMANKDVLEEYYYSTGIGTWSALTETNTLNGFQQSGVIAFNAPTDWAKTNVVVPAGAAISNAYYIKIVRTRNILGAPPVEDFFKIYTASSTTDFEIRGDGTIRPVEMADAAAPNNSFYYSLTQSKLVYKDNAGTVHDLW